MDNLSFLMNSLSFIEQNLNNEIKTEDIAKNCFASKSSLEKTFKYFTHFSVHDYIVRRRIMKASQLMITKPSLSLLDVAVEYGYSSHEAFTRAFYSVWNCTPSEFKEKYSERKKIPELFPQITGFFQNQGELFMRRTVDISQFYDLIIQRKKCYFVCCDIKSLIPINEISRKAGDLALSETMKRMLDCSSDEDIVFRFGADEFALLTNSEDITYAESIVNKILASNGKTFVFEDKEIPLNLYTSITKADEGTMHYDQLFTKLTSSIRK